MSRAGVQTEISERILGHSQGELIEIYRLVGPRKHRSGGASLQIPTSSPAAMRRAAAERCGRETDGNKRARGRGRGAAMSVTPGYLEHLYRKSSADELDYGSTGKVFGLMRVS
jgi:hypothetical protein